MEEGYLAVQVFFTLYHRRPVEEDTEQLLYIVRELRDIPSCFKKSPATVLGWYYHLEFKDSPWQDEKRIYYADGSYISKKYLVKSKKGLYMVKNEVVDSLFKDWNNKLKS